MMQYRLFVSNKEYDTIITGLRAWQAMTDDGPAPNSESLMMIATNEGEHAALTPAEIDKMVERLQMSGEDLEHGAVVCMRCGHDGHGVEECTA